MKIFISLAVLAGVSTPFFVQQEGTTTVETSTQEPASTVQRVIVSSGSTQDVTKETIAESPAGFSSASGWAPGDPGSRFAIGYGFASSMSENQKEAEQALAKARQTLGEAKTEEEKALATDQVRDALLAVYDERLDAYDEHLKTLREQLDEMAKKIDKRRDAREEMVDLRLKMMVQEADGLGWPDQTPPGFNQMWRFPATRTIVAPDVPPIRESLVVPRAPGRAK